MKNKLYASLFVWIGLTVIATPSLAKPSALPAKKPSAGAAKADKSNAHAAASNKKPEKTAPAKQQASGKNHAVEKHETKVADSKNKHDKADKHDKKAQQVADSKDSKNKHDKKSHQLADAEDNKHGKTKNHVAEAKDDKHDKHGKIKDQQLADADDKKHHRKKSQHAGNDSNQEENDSEDPSTAVYEDEAQSEATDSNVAQEHSNDLAPVAAKTSPLFFQPLDKSADPVFAEAKPNDKVVAPITEQANANPFAASPGSTNSRVHTTLGDSTMVNVDNRVHSSLAGNKPSSFISNADNHETQAHVKSTHGIIDGSLDEAGAKAGLSNDMIIELADVFAWDIDFANNIQTGDQFTVIYEDGAANAGNRIVAAQFVNRGKTYTAIRYKDKEGITSYYSPDGRSLRKAFLSTPIDFAQVSSHFDPHRMHPVLNRIRAHKGVDYAARTGTPVKAAGDGVVTFHGNKGGYGRMIVLAHGEHYETAYAHLSDFRQDLQDGEPVKQGDVIGYVGQSGLATGPHLHYEFRVDGEHRDPEKLDSKQAMRLPNGIWEDFHSQTVPILTQLNQAKSGTLVAKNP